jgi:hypothetical protein
MKFSTFYGTRNFITVFPASLPLFPILTKIKPVRGLSIDFLKFILILHPTYAIEGRKKKEIKNA